MRALGLSLVKRTVNFDDPSSHHLYLGDASGSPGTLVTYFTGSRLRRDGKLGRRAGDVDRDARAERHARAGRQRPARLGVPHAPSPGRFGDRALALDDPDGIRIELVEVDTYADEMWPTGLTR